MVVDPPSMTQSRLVARAREMTQTHIAHMLAVAASASAAFAPQTVQRPSRAAVCRAPPVFAQMVSAPEVYTAYYESLPSMQKNLEKTPAPVATGAMAGVVGAAGALGYLLTPSRRIAVNVVGGAITGSVGLLARKRIAQERKEAAGPAVAKMLSGGLQSVTAEDLASVASEYGVGKKQFQSQLSQLYAVFLGACLSSPQVVSSELGEVKKLGELLGLSRAELGSAVFQAGRQLYSRHRAYLEEDEPNDSKLLLDKYIFLAERVLSEDESEEGYRYESMRCQKLFSLGAAEWASKAEAAAVPFYEKALEKVSAGQPVVAAQLAQIRSTFGVGDGTAVEMHEAAYVELARGLLQPDGAAKFDDAARAKLSEAQALLALEADVAERLAQSLTSPLYSASVEAALAQLGGEGTTVDAAATAALSGVLSVRQQELMLPADAADALQREALRTLASAKLAEAATFLRAQNVPEAVAKARALVAYCGAMGGAMGAVGTVEGGAEAEAALFASLGGAAGCKDSELLSLYRLVLLDALNGANGLADEAEASLLPSLQGVLGLSKAEADGVYLAASSPLYRKAVREAVEAGDLGDAKKAALDVTLASINLPEATAAKMTVEVYVDELKKCAGEGKIIDEAQSAQLASLRAFLGLELPQVADAHEDLCGGTYADSVKQVMGVSGNIPDEYFEGLTKLRERLALTEEVTDRIYAQVATAKVKALGDKAVEALETKAKADQAAQKKNAGEQDADGGSASGLEGAALVGEISNLLEFASGARLLSDDGATCAATLRGQVEDRVVKELYRQYLVEGFSGGQPELQAKLFGGMGKLAAVLGLNAQEAQLVQNELGSLIYRQYLGKALQSNGPLGAQDEAFLSNVKDTLMLEADKCDETIKEMKCGRVGMLVENLFSSQVGRGIDAAEITAMRDTAELYELDLVDDVGVLPPRLEKMFSVELSDLLEKGELAPGDGDGAAALEEMCASMHISEEKAAAILVETIKKTVNGGVQQASALYRQDRNDEMVAELERVVKYARVQAIEVELPTVSSATRQEMLMLFQASLGGADPEKLELLKETMSLTGVAA